MVRVPVGQSPPHGSAGVAIVASTAVVVAASAIAAGVGAGALWVFEVLAATGLLIGLGAAFGVFERELPGPRDGFPGGRFAARQAAPELSASVEEQLQALDPVEHRRLDLGSPWPAVVIGPTGVTIVAVADRVGADHLARLRDIMVQIRRSTRAQQQERRIVVRALLVVPDGEVPGAASAEVRVIPVADVAGAVAGGPILPMSTVTAVFSRLSGELAPDLQLDTV